jgi:hypothetical protein
LSSLVEITWQSFWSYISISGFSNYTSMFLLNLLWHIYGVSSHINYPPPCPFHPGLPPLPSPHCIFLCQQVPGVQRPVSFLIRIWAPPAATRSLETLCCPWRSDSCWRGSGKWEHISDLTSCFRAPHIPVSPSARYLALWTRSASYRVCNRWIGTTSRRYICHHPGCIWPYVRCIARGKISALWTVHSGME